MPQSSICRVSRHSLVHVFPWIQCTGCMHDNYMVMLSLWCECICVHCLSSGLMRPIFSAHPVDVCIMNSYKTLIEMHEISSSAHTP